MEIGLLQTSSSYYEVMLDEVDPKSGVTGVLIRGETQTRTQGEDPVAMETKIGVMHLQV